MVVTPSGRRSSIRSRLLVRLLPFSLGLGAGATLLFSLLALVREVVGPLPSIAVAAGAAYAAAAAVRIAPSLPSSPWRVPRGWNIAGETPFAVVFGIVLGIGLLTAVATSGFYVVVLWALYAEWREAISVLLAFAVGRAVPSYLALLPRFRSDTPMFTWRLARLLVALRPAEAAPLVVLAAALSL